MITKTQIWFGRAALNRRRAKVCLKTSVVKFNDPQRSLLWDFGKRTRPTLYA